MQRLVRKFETAKSLVPAPVVRKAREKARYGAIYFGSTSAAMAEALVELEGQGLHLDTLRIRAFPFADAVVDFINSAATGRSIGRREGCENLRFRP